MTKLIVVILVQLIKMVPYVYLFIPYQTVLCLKTDHLTIICIHQYTRSNTKKRDCACNYFYL